MTPCSSELTLCNIFGPNDSSVAKHARLFVNAIDHSVYQGKESNL